MDVKEQILSKLRLKEGAEVEYKSAKGGFPQSILRSILLAIPIVVVMKGIMFVGMKR